VVRLAAERDGDVDGLGLDLSEADRSAGAALAATRSCSPDAPAAAMTLLGPRPGRAWRGTGSQISDQNLGSRNANKPA
jgi:hypothetical protein